jgi:hypothetical protein
MFDPAPYFADVAPHLLPDLLDEWGWLLGKEPFEVFRVTAMGDLFLIDAGGAIDFLDVMGGALEHFAASEREFDARIRESAARKRFLVTFVVRRLREAGVRLERNECYSPDVPIVLGGTLEDANLNPCEVYVHASIMGQIHRQLRDAPPGSPVNVRFE